MTTRSPHNPLPHTIHLFDCLLCFIHASCMLAGKTSKSSFYVYRATDAYTLRKLNALCIGFHLSQIFFIFVYLLHIFAYLRWHCRVSVRHSKVPDSQGPPLPGTATRKVGTKEYCLGLGTWVSCTISVLPSAPDQPPPPPGSMSYLTWANVREILARGNYVSRLEIESNNMDLQAIVSATTQVVLVTQ